MQKDRKELIGFEDLNINSELNLSPHDTENEDDNDENTSESSDSDTGPTDSDSDTDGIFSNKKPTNRSKKAKLICQFFYSSVEGDISWPVASFPLQKIDHRALSSLIWQVCEAIGSLTLENGEKIEVIYGVSDGSTYSHAFFSRAGAHNWVTYNPFNDNKPIWLLSDYHHMIKKLRNFIVNPDG